MANNFEAIIKARLDTSGVENQIKNEINNRQVNLHNVTVNTANLIRQIQEAFSNHTFAINVNSANVQNVVHQMGNIGQSAGQQFAQNFSGEIHRITLNNGGLGDVGNLLHQMGLDQNAINNATQGLQNMVVSIDEIRTRQLSNGNISIRLTGVDELNRGVEVLRVFENETGDIIHSQNQFTQSFEQRKQAVEEFNSSLQRATDALANGDIGAQISKVQQSFSAISGKVDSAQLSETTYQELHNTLLQVETDLEHLNTLEQTFANSGNLTSEQLVAHFNDYESTLNRVRNSLTTVNNTQRQFATSIEVTTLRNQMESWLNKNSRAAKTYGQTVRNLINQLDSATASGNVHKNTLNQLRNSYKEVDSAATAAGLKGKTFGDSLKGAVSSITRYISASTLIYSAIRAVKTGVSDVISLDTALVDLKKTTDASEAELKRFYYTANDVAKQLGVTTEEVISAASSWSRLGYSIQDAEVMAKTSSIFASISPDMGIEEATDGLVSAMKAFNIEADDALDGIASKVNAIGNSQAVSNADIVEFLSKSSAAMKEGNNTLEETIALGTAAQEIVRNASNVGQVLKTTSMRIRGYDEATEEYTGNVEILSGEIANLTKTASKPGGISLFTDDTKQTFKSTTQILREISQIWDELDDKTQASLLEKLAGKRNGNVVSAILSNFGAVEKSLDTMSNSAGNAEAEMSVIMESLDYKLNALKETATGFFQNLFEQEEMGRIIDFLTSLLNFITEITSHLGLLGTTVAGLGIYAAIKRISSVYKELNMAGALSDLTRLQKVTTTLQTAFPMLANVIDGVKLSMEAGFGATNTLKIALSGLWDIIKAHPVIAAVTAIIALAAAIDNAKKSAAQAAEETARQIAEEVSANKQEIDSLDELVSKYKELAKADRSDVSNREEIAKIQNEITSLVGSQADNLDLVNGKLDEELQKINQIYKTQNENSTYSYRRALSSKIEEYSNADRSIKEDKGFFLNGLDNLTSVTSEDLEITAWRNLLDKLNIDGLSIDYNDSLVLPDNMEQAAKDLREVIDAINEYETAVNNKDWKKVNEITGGGMNSTFDSAKAKGYFSDVLIEVEKVIGETESAAQDLIGNLLNSYYYSQGKQDLSEIENLDDYVNYRQKIIDDLSNDKDIKSAIEQGLISEDYIESTTDAFLAKLPEISKYYNDWYNKFGSDVAKSVIDLKEKLQADVYFFEPENLYKGKNNVIEDWFNNLTDGQKEIIVKIKGEYETDDWTFEEWQKALKNYKPPESAKFHFSDLISTDDFKDKIDDYKDKLTELDESLEKLRDGSLSEEDKISLFKNFPELASQADNLDEAIVNLISSTKSSVIEDFNEQLDYMQTDDDVAALNSLKDSILGLAKTAGNDDDFERFNEILNHLETKESCDNIDELRDKMKAYADEYNKLVGYGKKGNVDYNKRPVVSREDVKAKYPEFDGDYATTYDQGYQVLDSSGKGYALVVTPILENGEILSQQELDDYVDNVLNGSDDILKADTKKLVIHAEAEGEGDYWIKNDDGSLEFDFESFNEQLIPSKEEHLDAYLDINTNIDDLIPYAEKLGVSVEQLKSMGDIPSDLFASADEITKKISNLKTTLDELSDTYSNMKSIIDDHNDNGYFTLENLQSIMDMEPEYINLLIDENGQINLNSQAYKNYVIAKAKSLLINELQDLYNTVLGMKVEEAQAYANAVAYDEETRSVKDLLTATTQLYYAKAMTKDSANNTTAYTDAMKQSFSTAANYAAMVDDYINSLSTTQNEFSTTTNETTSALEAQKEALEDEKDALEDYKDSLEDAKDALEDYKDSLEDAQDDIQSLIDLTIDYIKQTKENEKSAIQDSIDSLEDKKDALDDQKDAYSDLISKKKEEIELLYEEKEAQDELSEKQKSAAKDALALAIAQLDDSSAGKKSQKQAADNYAESSKDLKDYLDEQEKDKRISALEEEETAYEEMIEKRKAAIDEQVEHLESKIDEIDDYLDNSRKLYEDACNMIDNDNGTLYSNLWNYTYTYTTQTRAEFDYLWSSAQVAIQRYKGDNDTLISTMEFLQGKIYDTDRQISDLNTQIDNCETQIGYLDDAISSTSNAISATSDSIDSVSGSLDGLGNSISDYINKLNQLTGINIDGTDNSDTTPKYLGHGYDASSGNYYYKVKFRGRDYYGYVGDSSDTTAVRERAYNAIMKEVYKYNSFNDVNPLLFKNAIVNHHAKGTRHSAGGVSVTQEEGLEAIFGKLSQGQYTMMPQGSQVFNAGMTDNLWKFSSDPQKFISDVIGKMSSFLSSSYGNFADSARGVTNKVTKYGGDVTLSSAPVYHIYGNVDKNTLSTMDKQERQRYELFKKQFMLEMLREKNNL